MNATKVDIEKLREILSNIENIKNKNKWSDPATGAKENCHQWI